MPSTRFKELWAIARLDFAEVARSRWLLFAAALHGGLAAIFVLVGLRESSYLGFTGMGRVLVSMVHTQVLVLPLVALTATGQVVNRARDDGTLELLFTLPVRRGTYFLAVTAVRYLALLVPLAASLGLTGLFGQAVLGQDVPWSFVGQSLALCAALLLAFVGLGVATSTWVRHPARAVITLLVLWAGGVALVDFALVGAMLQWRLNAASIFVLATLNPVQTARMGLLALASDELSVLGPVGFYLQHRVGPVWLFTLGVAWPLAVGVTSWALALRRFSRTDIV
jgi:ABC-type transport system involved in multi-copper enzyme maturation permease subunit